jgi:FkbM family methyltransferase
MRARMNALVRRALRTRGLKITHDRDDNWPPDIDILSLVVQSAFAKQPPRRLLQIGANDGGPEDPARRLIERYNLSAVLLEPLPEPFELLLKNYAAVPGITAVQAALDSVDGRRTIWRIVISDNGLSMSEMSSFERSVVEKHRPTYASAGGRIRQETVRTVSPKTVLNEFLLGEADLDILQVDTEGYDATVIHGLLDAGVAPKLINFEHSHLSGTADRHLCSLLRRSGYRLARYGRDTVAVLHSLEIV